MAEYIVRLPTEKVPLERMCFPVEKITGELVRCKDCKHGEVLNNCIMCNSGAHNPDWFCADGESR